MNAKKPAATHHVTVPIATVHKDANSAAEATSECLYGEQVEELARHDGWLKIRCINDSYEGYIREQAIHPFSEQGSATHWVKTRSTLLFGDASIKSPVIARIPFQSRLAIDGNKHEQFSRTFDGYYVWNSHLMRLDEQHTLNPTDLAQSLFLGAPYVWGGRSTEGLDCSGLIQALAGAHGLLIPRDSHEQETYIKSEVDPLRAQAMDLVYWPGHVGILLSETCLLHATAYSLSCVIEPLSDVVQRAGNISSVRRLFNPE